MRALLAMVHDPARRAALGAAATLALTACGGARLAGTDGGAPTRDEGPVAIHVAAEGPCPRLSAAQLGARTLLVFGDTGYYLRGWLPGDEVPAAQSLAVLDPRGAGRDPRLLEGLPRDERGYVPGSLLVGGSRDEAGWLIRVTSRYAPGGLGALFARERDGFVLGTDGWRRAEVVVERPPAARGLPLSPPDATCGEGRTLVPLASAVTTDGGVVVAGRCDDERPQNPAEVELFVGHGRAGATTFRMERVPGTENLDGIVNVALDARGDDDVVLTAWEPFLPPERRTPFVARWDGRGWRRWELPLARGVMDVARTGDGTTWLVDGRALHAVDAAGAHREVALPPPHFAEGSREAIHLHAVRRIGDSLWVEGRYRLLREERAPEWASVLYTTMPTRGILHCDAGEPAERALTRVEEPER